MTQPAPEPCTWYWPDECGCGPAVHHSPCWPRPPAPDCCAQWDSDDVTDEQRERAQRIAVEILWRLSGMRFGCCPVTVRPCRDTCLDRPSFRGVWSGNTLQPVLESGRWFNDPCGSCRTSCSCVELCEVTLPGPVESIVEIRLDGLVLPATEYRVDDHRKLVAVGEHCWPTCQNLNLPPTQAGTWSVTYTRGVPVPEGGRWAAGLLACELLKACAPGLGACVLPNQVQRVVREGITLDLEAGGVSPGSSFRTGIPEVDLWLEAVNPGKLRQPSVVYSVDRPPPRTTTWPGVP